MCFNTVHEEAFIQLFKPVIFGADDISSLSNVCLLSSCSKDGTRGRQMQSGLENMAGDGISSKLYWRIAANVHAAGVHCRDDAARLYANFINN